MKRAAHATPETPLFSAFAESLYQDRVLRGKLKSQKTRERWQSVLRVHLNPVFGQLRVSQLTRERVQAWGQKQAGKAASGKVRPATVNNWFSLLRTISKAMTQQYDLERDPCRGLENIEGSDAPTYTDEEPNALTPQEAMRFLVSLRETCPSAFAMVMLGFVTGLRPSSLRALRRKGPSADVLWEESAILVRRSHATGQTAMNTTKTRKRQRVGLPESVMKVLREQAAWLEEPPPATDGKWPRGWRPAMRTSDLLFPSLTGGFRTRSFLDRPFRIAAENAGIRKKITPRAMRRTFQDLARAAQMSSLVKRSVSGHATEVMEEHYSTVWQEEMREGLGRVCGLIDGTGRAAAVEQARETPRITLWNTREVPSC